MMRLTKKSVLQTLIAGSLLSMSATHAAEQTVVVEGELIFSSLPMLTDYQGPLAEPLLFTATITENPDLAEASGIIGLSKEYLEALRAVQMQIRTADGTVLYDETASAADFALASTLELYSLFAYGDSARATGYPSGSASWLLISASEERFVDREIYLGTDLLSRGVGMGAEASIASLFADISGYPVLTTGAYTYAFLYYEANRNNLTGEGSQGIVQGYTTRVSYGSADADSDGVQDDLDSCPGSDITTTVIFGSDDSGVANSVNANGCTVSDLLGQCAVETSCTMQLIQTLRQDGTLTVHEANTLRQTYQISAHSNRP